MKEVALRAASTQGAGAFGARPSPRVDPFMDECVAVAVAEAVAVAVTEAVAEADQSIRDQTIRDPLIATIVHYCPLFPEPLTTICHYFRKP